MSKNIARAMIMKQNMIFVTAKKSKTQNFQPQSENVLLYTHKPKKRGFAHEYYN